MQLPINLDHPCYHDDEAARALLETLLWPDGPFCPYCGSPDRVYAVATPPKAKGGGWHRCSTCRKRFTVRVGSIFHRSHVALHKWLLGFRLMAGSKKGISAHQLHRTLNVDYKTAWFLEHRIRECMDENDSGPIGGEGKTLPVRVYGQRHEERADLPSLDALFEDQSEKPGFSEPVSFCPSEAVCL